jgi:hypothetical protein
MGNLPGYVAEVRCEDADTSYVSLDGFDIITVLLSIISEAIESFAMDRVKHATQLRVIGDHSMAGPPLGDMIVYPYRYLVPSTIPSNHAASTSLAPRVCEPPLAHPVRNVQQFHDGMPVKAVPGLQSQPGTSREAMAKPAPGPPKGGLPPPYTCTVAPELSHSTVRDARRSVTPKISGIRNLFLVPLPLPTAAPVLPLAVPLSPPSSRLLGIGLGPGSALPPGRRSVEPGPCLLRGGKNAAALTQVKVVALSVEAVNPHGVGQSLVAKFHVDRHSDLPSTSLSVVTKQIE